MIEAGELPKMWLATARAGALDSAVPVALTRILSVPSINLLASISPRLSAPSTTAGEEHRDKEHIQ
jgi:hypothetical protein